MIPTFSCYNLYVKLIFLRLQIQVNWLILYGNHKQLQDIQTKFVDSGGAFDR